MHLQAAVGRVGRVGPAWARARGNRGLPVLQHRTPSRDGPRAVVAAVLRHIVNVMPKYLT